MAGIEILKILDGMEPDVRTKSDAVLVAGAVRVNQKHCIEKKCFHLGPYIRAMPKALWWS